jgi:RecA/RadA recombinase
MAKLTKEDRDLALKETLRALGKSGHKVVSANSLPALRRVQVKVPAYDYTTYGGFIINQVNEHVGDPSGLKSYLFYKGVGEFQHYDWANNEQSAFREIKWKKRKSMEEIPEVISYTLRRGYKPTEEPVIKYAVLIDMEGTYSAEWGEAHGIDNDGLIYIRPDSLNRSIDVADAFLRNPAICLVMYDSMSAVGADAEQEAGMEKEQMAINARFWNKASRLIRGAMNSNPEYDVTLFIINSIYSKVGVVFGNPEVVKNGIQMGLLKSSSVKMTTLKEHKGVIDGNEVTVGRNIKMKCLKNKFGPALREATLYFSYQDDGELEVGETDIMAQLIELGIRYKLIERVGNGYEYNGVKGKGMESFKKAMYTEKMGKQLEIEVYEKIKN